MIALVATPPRGTLAGGVHSALQDLEELTGSPLFTLYRAQDGSLFVLLGEEARVEGRIVSAGRGTRVTPGATLQVGTVTILLSEQRPSLHLRLALDGRRSALHVHQTDGTVTLTSLAERRALLLLELLNRGPVGDETLIGALWPQDVVRTRLDLNQLVHRTRQDLARAGLVEEVTLLRHPAGGTTEMRMSPGTTLEGARPKTSS